MTERNFNAGSGASGNLKDVLYSPMLTREKFGKDAPKSKRWIMFAFMAALLYTGYNYAGGINKLNAIATKVVSTFVSFVLVITIHTY